jgi:4-amino-4-deoxy-L-arabinose transferase-like glycosyltransferase
VTLQLSRIGLWILAAVVLAVAIDNLDRPLANPDEGRYSEISREMAASGDWVTPRLNGLKYFEKPPLQYWASAAAFKAFGTEEFAARLYVGLCGLLTLLVVGYTAARLGTVETGVASALALVASPYFFALAGVVTLDMGLTLWTTATSCAYALAEAAPDAAPSRRRWMLAAWAAMALAVLSKGLVGVVFPAAAIGLHCLARRDLSPLARLEWGYGIVVFLAIAAPWFLAVSFANPEFAEFFFVHEHFTRFLAANHRRTEPWWYFLPILFAALLPWVFALPAALAHGWRAEALARGGPQPRRLAILYAVFVVAFFSASSSKLPTYVLPALPMLALVLGPYLVQAPLRRLAVAILPVAAVALLLGVLAWQAPAAAREPWTRELYAHASPWMLAAACALLATALAGPWLLWRGRRWIALMAMATGMVLMVGALLQAFERLSPRQSGLDVAEKMVPLIHPGTRLYSVRMYDQGVPFYTGRALRLVEYVDEFELGLRAQPEAGLARLDDFRADWVRPGDALAIMQPDIFLTLRALGLPMQLVHEDPRRVLVRKP